MTLDAVQALASLPPHAAVAVGGFDGVHLGHRALLAEMLAFASRTGRPACVLTFEDGSPRDFLDPSHAPGHIYDDAHQVDCLTALTHGMARMIRLRFDAALAAITATDFAGFLHDASIFCGEDWRFGKGAEGSPATLRADGFDVHVVPYVFWEGARISSTRIRAMLAEGRLDAVAAMLGTPWSFTGAVVHGRGLAGPTFGVPTLNIPYRGRGCEDVRMAPLAHGVYRAQAELRTDRGRQLGTWSALVNFGTAPSVKGEQEPLFEAHLLGAEGDFYGAVATLRFDTPLLRPERRFDSLDALRRQIHMDLASCGGQQ